MRDAPPAEEDYEPHPDAGEMYENIPAVAGDPAAIPGAKVHLPDGRHATVCEPAPGRRVALVDAESLPTHGIVKMLRQTDGRYLPVVTRYGKLVRLSDQLPRELGIEIHPRVLKRLVSSGLVRGSRPGPDTLLIDLGSLLDHPKRTQDPA